MSKLRIGVIGCSGAIAAHQAGYRRMADLCEVVAVAEPDGSRHAATRQMFGTEISIDQDYRETAARSDIDAVDIALPADLHMPATVAAAEAGKHVLVEQVMARTVPECDRMIEACDKAAVSLTVCHDRRYCDPLVALKEVVDSGALGEVFYWKLDRNESAAPPEDRLLGLDPVGSEAALSCLASQIDSLRWYGGEIASLTCMAKRMPQGVEGGSVGVIVAHMESDALAQLSASWWAGPKQAAGGVGHEIVQAYGTAGEAYYTSGRGTFVLVRDTAQRKQFPQYAGESPDSHVLVRAGDADGHAACVAEWVKMLRGEPSRITTTGRDARNTVEAAEAADISAATGRTVTLPVEGRP